MRYKRPTIWSLDPLSKPDREPITLEEARLDRRLDADGSPAVHPDDALLLKLITRAREHVENYTSRTICPRRWRLRLSRFPNDDEPISLMRLPVLAIESFKVNGVDFTAYENSIDEFHADLYPLHTVGCWPMPAIPKPGLIEIIYRAGYMSGSPLAFDVPEVLQGAMYLLLGHWYENRESVAMGTLVQTVPDGWESLLIPYVRSATC